MVNAIKLSEIEARYGREKNCLTVPSGVLGHVL